LMDLIGTNAGARRECHVWGSLAHRPDVAWLP
jgi:hypothetical protein